MSKIEHEYPDAGGERKKEQNRTFHGVSAMDLMGDNVKEYGIAIEHIKSLLRKLKVLVKNRFASFENPVFKAMKIFDPKFWNMEEESYGIEELEEIFCHFKVPLTSTGFQLTKAKREWQSFKDLVAESYSKFEPHQLWHMTISKREKEFPNICLLVKLVMVYLVRIPPLNVPFLH